MNINKRISSLDQKFEAISGNNSKKFTETLEKVNQTKIYLEQKIEAAMAIEAKFEQNREDLKQV